MLTTRFICLAVALASLLFVQPALACKCAPHPVDQALTQADAVFEGRVTAITEVPAADNPQAKAKSVTLSIVRVWKALEDVETVTLTTNSESAACGYHFEPNSSYLVYASRNEQGLHVTSCSRTRPMADAGEDLATLGAGVTPVKITNAPVPAAPAEQAPAANVAKPAEPAAPEARRGCSVNAAGQRPLSGAALALPIVGLGLWLRRRVLPARGRACRP
jgi:hypothetical protein